MSTNDNAVILCPKCGKVNKLAHEDGAVDGPRAYHAACWVAMNNTTLYNELTLKVIEAVEQWHKARNTGTCQSYFKEVDLLEKAWVKLAEAVKETQCTK